MAIRRLKSTSLSCSPSDASLSIIRDGDREVVDRTEFEVHAKQNESLGGLHPTSNRPRITALGVIILQPVLSAVRFLQLIESIEVVRLILMGAGCQSASA